MKADLYNLGVEKGILNYGLISLYYNSVEEKGKRHECIFWHPALLRYFETNVNIEIASGLLTIKQNYKEDFSIALSELYSASACLCEANDAGFLVKIGYYSSDKNYCYFHDYKTFFNSPIFKELKKASDGCKPSFYDERVFVQVQKQYAGTEFILVESTDSKTQVYCIDGTPFHSISKPFLSRKR